MNDTATLATAPASDKGDVCRPAPTDLDRQGREGVTVESALRSIGFAGDAPVAMIFVPSKDGISHNEIEDAKPEHLAAGCNVLLHAMLEHAGIAA